MSVFSSGKSGFGGGGGGAASVSLNLTALMDILSNLLFFLLASYTTQDLEVKKPNLHLPPSSSDLRVVPGLVVTVTSDEILVADVPVARVQGDQVADVDEDNRVPPLYDRLRNVKAAREAAGYEGVAGAETLLLLADRSVDSGVITQVLRTAGEAGFVNVRFGVLAR